MEVNLSRSFFAASEHKATWLGNTVPNGWQKCKKSVPGLVFTAGLAGQPG